jgi:hypothetical protein
MLVGHFAVGMGAKPIAPRVSVGTLMLAAVVADLLFWLFVLLGVEHVRIQPGITATNALDLYDIPLSHSLLMDTVWAVLLGSFYFLRHRSPRGGQREGEKSFALTEPRKKKKPWKTHSMPCMRLQRLGSTAKLPDSVFGSSSAHLNHANT